MSSDNTCSSANTSGNNSGISINGSSIIGSSTISSITSSITSGFSVIVIISVGVSCMVVFNVGTPKSTPTDCAALDTACLKLACAA